MGKTKSFKEFKSNNGKSNSERHSDSKFKHKDGTYIGDNGVFLVKRTRKNKRGTWMGEMICPFCHKHFEHDIASIASNAVKSCGCQAYPPKKYSPGDLVGPNKIKFLGYTKKDSSDSWLGKFQCPHCPNVFETRVSRVSSGEGHKDCGCQEAHRRKNNGKKNIKDLSGEKFGRLTALSRTEKKACNGTYIWKCVCDCQLDLPENERQYTYRSTRSLLDGKAKGKHQSCGCWQNEIIIQIGQANAKDLTGQTFGFLEALYRDGTTTRGTAQSHAATWTCLCHNCGRNAEHISAADLISGNTKSCGRCNINVSVGEQRLIETLELLDIAFEDHKTFDTCINPETGRSLIFDVYLSDDDILIEFDGPQHFGYYNNSVMANKECYTKSHKRDLYKNDWCNENQIPLIRIPYCEECNLSEQYLLKLIEQVRTTRENIFVPLSGNKQGGLIYSYREYPGAEKYIQ